MNSDSPATVLSGAKRGRGLAHTTLSGLFWMAMGAGAQGFFQLLVTVVLARLLTPADFGMVSATLVVVGFSTIFSQLGVGPAVVQHPSLGTAHLRTGFTLSALFGLGMTFLIWGLTPVIAAFFRMDELIPVVRVMALVFAFQGLSVVSESLLQRELRFRKLAAIEVTALTGFGLIGVTLAYMGLGVWSLVAAYLSQATLKTILLLVLVPHPRRPLLDRRAGAELMYFGGGFTAARMGNYFGAQGDSMVVGRWLGADALGYYGRAYQLMVAPAMLVGQILDRVLFPAMAKVQGRSERLLTAFRRSVTLIAILMFPVSLALFFLAPEVIHVLLGPRWTETVLPFQIFSLGLLFRTSYKMSDSVARATGAVYRRAWRQWVFAGLVVGGAGLGSLWGVAGVAVCVSVAITCNFFLMAHLSLQLSGMSWKTFLLAHMPAASLGAVVGLESWALGSLLRGLDRPPIEILAACAAALIVTVAALFKFLPGIFLGRDGVWMFETLAAYLPGRTKRFHVFLPVASSVTPGRTRI